MDGEIFVDESIERTQELVSHLIARPKMAPKLLNKPPFRFLHDTFTQVCSQDNPPARELKLKLEHSHAHQLVAVVADLKRNWLWSWLAA